jgi:hypothetical protein
VNRAQRYAVALTLAPMLWAPMAFAQLGPATAGERATNGTANSGTADSVGSVNGTSVAATAASGDSDVSITLATTPRGVGTWGVSFFNFTLTAPIKDGEKEGRFVTDDGLTGSFNAKLGVTFLLIDTTASTETIALIGDLTALYDRNCRADPAYVATDDCTMQMAVTKMEYPKLQKYLGVRYPELRTAYGRALDDKPLWIINLGGSVGYGQYSYLTPTTFAENEDHRTPYSLSASIGWQAHRDAPLLAAGYEYKQGYKAGEARIVCLAANNCKSDIFDGPTSDRSQNLFGLVRFSLAGKHSDPLAPPKRGAMLGLKLGYDFEAKRFGVSVPLYFLLDKDGKLKGGVRFDWQERDAASSQHNTKFAVFISKSFGFLDF